MSDEKRNKKLAISPIANFNVKDVDSDPSEKHQHQINHPVIQSESLSLLATAGISGRLRRQMGPPEQRGEKSKQSSIFWLQLFSMFIFIFTSTCSKENTGVDLAFLVGALMAIPICAKQTGANLNPAVSYSMTFKYVGIKFSYLQLLFVYVKAQIIGAILAIIVAALLNGVYRQPLFPQVLVKNNLYMYQDNFSILLIIRIILSEAIGIFVLIFLILYGTGPFSFITNDGAKYCFIAVFIYIGRKFAVMSGNQINFALTVSQAFVGFSNCNFQGFKYLVFWLIGDAIGVILAASLYNNIVEPTLSYMEVHNSQKIKSQLEKERQIQMSEMKDAKFTGETIGRNMEQNKYELQQEQKNKKKFQIVHF